MVMKFIDGMTLSTFIENRNGSGLPIDSAMDIFKQVCNCMAHAHGKGLLHRDLKPSNIMLLDLSCSQAYTKIYTRTRETANEPSSQIVH